MHYFYPYKHLLDWPWSTVRTHFIPRFLASNSAVEYEMTVAEMVARIQDTHGRVGFRSAQRVSGHVCAPAYAAIRGRKVGYRRVTRMRSLGARAAGLNVGDVILSVDGEPAEQRVAFLSKFKALSTRAGGRPVHSSLQR